MAMKAFFQYFCGVYLDNNCNYPVAMCYNASTKRTVYTCADCFNLAFSPTSIGHKCNQTARTGLRLVIGHQIMFLQMHRGYAKYRVTYLRLVFVSKTELPQRRSNEDEKLIQIVKKIRQNQSRLQLYEHTRNGKEKL